MRIKTKEEKSDVNIDNNPIADCGNYSIPEIDTNEYHNEEEEEKNAIEPGFKKVEKKLKKHLENNFQEIREEVFQKVSLKVPKLGYRLKSKI